MTAMETIESAFADCEDNEITCDFLVPLTVRVNVETGQATEVWLHLEEFQSSASGWFAPVGAPVDSEIKFCLRNAFIAFGDGEDYCADGESELGDKALAIADRVRIINPEFQLRFELKSEEEVA